MVDILQKLSAPDVFLIVFLIICSYTDLKYRKVFNFATFPAILTGLLINTAFSGFAGFQKSALGLFAGSLFLLLFFLIGAIGAGDIKFMAAVGSLKGWSFTLIGGLYGAIFGGICAILILSVKKDSVTRLKNVFQFLYMLFAFKTIYTIDRKSAHYLPYSSILSVGFLIYLIEELLR